MQSISRRSAKIHIPDEVALITSQIGELTDRIMLPLFDRLRPFAVHNRATRELLEALNDPSAVADPVQAKCRALLFDGAGNRHVFDEHEKRLKERANELREQGQAIPAHLSTQLTYCNSEGQALLQREDSVKLTRSFLLFNIDVPNFQNRDRAIVDAETREVRARGKAIFESTLAELSREALAFNSTQFDGAARSRCAQRAWSAECCGMFLPAPLKRANSDTTPD